MIGYYFYGRDPQKGYISVNHQYTKKDEENYFSVLSSYMGAEYLKEDFPVREYYYNVPSSKGDCTIVGRTFPIPAGSDGDARSTVFVHQYLFQGEDRARLMKQADDIFQIKSFCTKYSDIYSGNTYLIDESNRDVFEEVREVWTVNELLDYFGICEKELEELLYTVFFCRWKVYIRLPEDTTESTEKALAFMRKLIGILPPSLVNYAGFLSFSYAFGGTAPENRIPTQIRYVFLADTPENRMKAGAVSQQRRIAVYGMGVKSGVEIPAEMGAVLEEMKLAFLYGNTSRELAMFWDLLDATITGIPMLEVESREFAALYELGCEQERMICCASAGITEKQIEKFLNILLENPNHWTAGMENVIIQFVKSGLEYRSWGTDIYQMLFRLYERYSLLQKEIVVFFCNQVTDEKSLKKLDSRLEYAQKLRKEVMASLSQIESCYPAVVGNEFSKMALAGDTYDEPEIKLRKLWNVLGALKSNNVKLLETEKCYCETQSWLCGCLTTKNPLRVEKELLDDCVENIRRLHLSSEYMDMVKKLAVSYHDEMTRRTISMEDAKILSEWPREFMGKGAMSGKYQRTMKRAADVEQQIEKIQKTKTLSRMVGMIEKFFRGINCNELTEEEQQRIICEISNRADACVEESKRPRELQRDYDMVMTLLIRFMPRQTERIAVRIMRNPLGGLGALSCLYKRTWRWSRNIKYDMNKAICKYFEEYEMDKTDKKAIKREREFLEELGLDAKQLLKKYK